MNNEDIKVIETYIKEREYMLKTRQEILFKRAIEELKSLSPSEQSIETILNLIEKQDKLINILAEQLTTPVHNKEWVIKY